MPFIVKHWEGLLGLLLIAILVGLFETQRLEIHHYKADYTKDQATIKALQLEAKAQDQRAAATDAANKADHATLQTQLDQALDAHRATSAALADRVRAYEAARNACQVSAKPDPPGPIEGRAGGNSGAGPAQSVGDAVAGLTSSCQTLIDEFHACATWAKTVRCQ